MFSNPILHCIIQNDNIVIIRKLKKLEFYFTAKPRYVYNLVVFQFTNQNFFKSIYRRGDFFVNCKYIKVSRYLLYISINDLGFDIFKKIKSFC